MRLAMPLSAMEISGNGEQIRFDRFRARFLRCRPSPNKCFRGDIPSIVWISRQPVREAINILGVPLIQVMKRCLTCVDADTIPKQ